MNFYLLIICVIIGIIFGIIGGALWLIIKIIISQKKAIKDYKKGRIMSIKNSPKEKIEDKPKKSEVPTPTK